MKHLIEFGLKTYRLNMLTSMERIICQQDPRHSSLSKRFMSWKKCFNFGGESLIIEKYFTIPMLINTRKDHWWQNGSASNPAWNFWDNCPSFHLYKEKFGEDKEWLDYCSYIAEKTNSIKEFEFVREQSQIILDMLKEID